MVFFSFHSWKYLRWFEASLQQGAVARPLPLFVRRSPPRSWSQQPEGPTMATATDLIAFRARFDLTEEHLAQALGVSRLSLHQWERGVSGPRHA
jgi:hypothetical protein